MYNPPPGYQGSYQPNYGRDDDKLGAKVVKDPVLHLVRWVSEFGWTWLPRLCAAVEHASMRCCRWFKTRNEKQRLYLGIGGGVLVSAADLLRFMGRTEVQ